MTTMNIPKEVTPELLKKIDDAYTKSNEEYSGFRKAHPEAERLARLNTNASVSVSTTEPTQKATVASSPKL